MIRPGLYTRCHQGVVFDWHTSLLGGLYTVIGAVDPGYYGLGFAADKYFVVMPNGNVEEHFICDSDLEEVVL